MPFRDKALEASEQMQAEQKENPDVWLMAHKEGDSNMYIIKTRDADMANKMMACMNPKPLSWTHIKVDEAGKLCNLPEHEQEVLFKYGNNVYAGIFVDDKYPDDSGDFGFYSHEDKYFEAEHVTLWMPQPPLPTNDIKSDKSDGK